MTAREVEEVVSALLLGLRALAPLGAEELEVRGDGFRLLIRRPPRRRRGAEVLVASPVTGRVSYAQAGRTPAPGTKVHRGETVAVVESMKVAVEVTAEVEGTVARVLVPEGGSVEAGEGLLEIAPEGER